MNGKAFDRLENLKIVYLESNACINENFLTKTQIIEIARVVSDKCGFVEIFNETSSETKLPETTTASVSNHETNSKALLDTQLAEIAKLSGKLSKLQTELNALVIAKAQAETQTLMLKEIYERLDAQRNETCRMIVEKKSAETSGDVAKLRGELHAAKLAKDRAEIQTTLLKEVYAKLEIQRNETFAAKMELKLQEISIFSSELQRTKDELKDRNEKIKILEAKVAALEGQKVR